MGRRRRGSAGAHAGVTKRFYNGIHVASRQVVQPYVTLMPACGGVVGAAVGGGVAGAVEVVYLKW